VLGSPSLTASGSLRAASTRARATRARSVAASRSAVLLWRLRLQPSWCRRERHRTGPWATPEGGRAIEEDRGARETAWLGGVREDAAG
jgi:hypothetical protein